NFMPSKYDLILVDEGEYVFSESVTSIPDAVTREAKTSVSKPKSVGEPLIEDWISDSEDENETEFKYKQRKPSFAKTEFVKSNEHVKTPRESVKKIENKKQAKYPRKNSQSPRDCDLYEKKMVEKSVWNNAKRANHQNSQRMTHPHPKGNFVPKAVLMKSGIKSLNTAGQNFSKAAVSVNTGKPINTAYTRPTLNIARKASNILNKAHTHVRRPFNKSTINKNSILKEKVNTIKGDVTTVGPKAVVSNNKGNEANVVKASACWVWRPKQKVLDHVFRHNGASMNFKRFDYVDAQGKLDFEDVYFVKELKFNLFSVSQMCDKKNSVLFTNIECVVLSPDFKLLDENHVLLRVPRKDKMYSVDLKNIVPSGGKKPALSFMRPFGCPVTILNTLDHLGNGPNWLSDIDALTISMNYKPVMAGNQTNGNAGTKENIDAGQDRKKIIPDKNYILLPLLRSDPSLSKSSKDSPDAGFKPSGEDEMIDYEYQENEDCEVPNTEELRVNQEQDANVNNTNNINTVSPTVSAADIENNVVDENIVYGCIDDLNMPNLEEIVYSDDDEEVGAEADMNNLATNMPVSPILTTRVNKDHLVEQIIGDIHSTPQTRRMTKNVTEHGMFSSVQQRINHKDFQNCLFACFLSQVEPKKVIQALTDPSWIEAMQDELLQFKLQKVWTLVDLPHGKRAIGTKWVYKNKKDDRGIVVRNKAKLLAQGYTQEEGIDYDKCGKLEGGG
ncbi:putative ribonuclease H-like domain-containing protein, partial [Tanacetum coccineum]